MGLFVEQIEKARARGAGLDLAGLADRAREKTPSELTPPKQIAERQAFLRESLGDTPQTSLIFERIINGNEIQDINYLARGARAAKAVARVAIRAMSGKLMGFGTGFLIAPQVLITNNHVLPSEDVAIRSEAQFGYERDIDGGERNPVVHSLAPRRLFFTSRELDFTVVCVEQRPQNAETELSEYGCIPLVGTPGKVTEGEWLTIIQHPNGERKQVCVRENKLLKRAEDVLWYSTDTLGGSSGSPVFNNDWYVVALHHSGVPLERDGRIQTIHNRDYDPARDGEQDIKWIANEGIRVSRIVDTLRKAHADHPLLRPVFAATPESARILPPSNAGPVPARSGIGQFFRVDAPTPDFPKEIPMSSSSSAGTRTVLVTLQIEPSGQATVVAGGETAQESLQMLEAARKKEKRGPAIDVPFDATYKDREGYNPRFLGAAAAHQVHLPKLGDGLVEAAAKLLASPRNYELKYHNYSVVMHEKRRLAIYSAANVDFAGRFEMSRPPDVWRQDPRISAAAQLTNFYYASNQFDRGHLTRREDLEFGKKRMDALVSAADTCHWTNCTPQHARFNQNKELWQGIERHILEESVKEDGFKVQIFTGPILEEDDPVWERFPKIQYPVRFWKVVAAINASNKLFATAFVLDQSEVIGRFGIEAVGEIPIGPYKTFQVTIDEVERLTGLTFWSGDKDDPTSLKEADPLKKPPRSRPRTVRMHESAVAPLPAGYLPLEALDSIHLG